MCDGHESGGHHELAGKRDALMPPNPEELASTGVIDRFPFGRV